MVDRATRNLPRGTLESCYVAKVWYSMTQQSSREIATWIRYQQGLGKAAVVI